MARIFISYRSSDGRDKATALARDLGALYGDLDVFLDKEDLRAGSRWRDEIAQTLKARPVLLLLLTPQLLAATDDRGRRRIDDPADPVRRELADALAGGAHLIPLLCDGLTAPQAADLPTPFDRLGEFTWRQLRAYDWEHDLERLVEDLRALGLTPTSAATGIAPVAAGDPPTTAPSRRRWLLLPLVALPLAVGVGWYLLRPPTTASTTDVSGAWLATLAPDREIDLWLRQTGDQVELNSRPVSIREHAEWVEYRAFWREHFGKEIDAVSYRGQGSASARPGAALVVDIALQIVSSPGDVLVDTGNLNVTMATDGATMSGELWLNGKQTETRVSLARMPAAN